MSNPYPFGAALLLGVAALFIPGCSDSEPQLVESQPVAWDPAGDPRLVALLARCPQSGHFDGDTSDIVPVLVDKLPTAQLDVRRNLCEELGTLGELPIPAIDALVRRFYTDRFGVPALRNAIAVLRLSEAEGAREILARCLQHPSEDVRGAAAAGMGRHSTPEDYDVLGHLLAPGVASAVTRQSVLTAMYHADPERLIGDALDWFQEGRHTDLWPGLARCLADSEGPRAGERIAEFIDELPRGFWLPFLLAAISNSGDESALELLSEGLRSGAPAGRTTLLEAIDLSSEPSRLVEGLQDPDPVLRARAASLIAKRLPADWARAGLAVALNDLDPGVRLTAQQALLALSDPAAIERVIAMLDGKRKELEDALHALRENWEANPGLERRAFELLTRRMEQVRGLPIADNKAIYQALGQIPDPRAVELLLELARNQTDWIGRLPGPRWLVRQAGSTEVGRTGIREAWRSESDLELRLNLLEAASFGLDAVTREFLLEVLHSEQSSPWEILFAAERLARQGPSQELAPVLKRAALRERHPLVRPAMDCLMWRWYGPAE